VSLDLKDVRTKLAIAAIGATLLSFIILATAGTGPRPDGSPTAGGTPTELTPVPPEQPPADEPTPPPATETPAPDPEPAAEPEPAPAPEPEPEPEPQQDPGADAPEDRAPPPPPPPEPGDALWGNWYRASQFRAGNETVAMAGDGPLHVGFHRSSGGDVLVWTTSCNTFGGDLLLGEGRLRVTDVTGSGDSCADEDDEVDHLAEQEAWLVEFFEAEPRWRRLGNRLRLWTDEGRIDLVLDAAGPDDTD
jgi:hypothetical protein